MVPFFLSTLLISVCGLVTLFGVKYWELRTGGVIFAGLRQKMGWYFSTIALWGERIIPALARIYGRRAWRSMQGYVHQTIARIVVVAEYWLERTLHQLRRTTEVRYAPGEASPFLREVAEHKRKLIRGERVRRVKESKVRE